MINPQEIAQWEGLVNAAVPLGLQVLGVVQQLLAARHAALLEEDNAMLAGVKAGCDEHIARIEAEEAAEGAK